MRQKQASQHILAQLPAQGRVVIGDEAGGGDTAICFGDTIGVGGGPRIDLAVASQDSDTPDPPAPGSQGPRYLGISR